MFLETRSIRKTMKTTTLFIENSGHPLIESSSFTPYPPYERQSVIDEYLLPWLMELSVLWSRSAPSGRPPIKDIAVDYGCIVYLRTNERSRSCESPWGMNSDPVQPGAQ